MVRNLGIEDTTGARKPAAAAAGRPAGGRRARARSGQGPGARPSGSGDGAPPGSTGEGGGEPPKPKKQRNRRHGRPR